MKTIYKDLIERVTWTAVQAFLAAFTIGGVDNTKAAAIAAVAAALSVIKGFAATRIGNPNSAATIR